VTVEFKRGLDDSLTVAALEDALGQAKARRCATPVHVVRRVAGGTDAWATASCGRGRGARRSTFWRLVPDAAVKSTPSGEDRPLDPA
jgi:hypothetical protein